MDLFLCRIERLAVKIVGALLLIQFPVSISQITNYSQHVSVFDIVLSSDSVV